MSFWRNLTFTGKELFLFVVTTFLIIFSLALHVMMIRAFPDPIVQVDSAGYFMPALNFLHNHIWDIPKTRTPGYPLFISFLLSLFGSFSAIVVAQHLIHLLTAGLVSVLYFYFFKRSFVQSFIVGWLLSISPEGIIYAHTLMTDNLFSFVYLLAIASFFSSLRSGNLSQVVLTAFLASLVTFVRPVGLAFIAALSVCYFLMIRINFKLVVVFLLSTVIFLGLWSAHNKKTKGFWQLTSGNGEALFGPSAFLLDIDDSLPPKVREQLQPVYETYRLTMYQDHAFVMGDPRGPGAALSKLSYDKTVFDALLKQLAFKAITDHPVLYARHIFDDLIQYHRTALAYPGYLVFPAEYTAWLGFMRYWFSIERFPNARQLMKYSFPTDYLAAHPQIGGKLNNWHDSAEEFVMYRQSIPDPYLNRLSLSGLYPFEESIITTCLKPVIYFESWIPAVAIVGSIFLLLPLKNTRMILVSCMIISIFHLVLSAIGAGVDTRYALPLQPIYLCLFVFFMATVKESGFFKVRNR